MAKAKGILHPRVRKTQTVVSRPQEAGDEVPRTKIRIIGVGGGGSNIVSEIAKDVARIDFVGANTDLQALKTLSKNVKRFSFGEELTHGLGCGMDATLGETAARADKEHIKKMMEGQDICILISSLGGGTGSGATPVFAEVSKELRNLTLGIFCMPFSFEGEKRKQLAVSSLEKLKPIVNAFVLIPNENIFRMIDAKTSLKESLSVVNRLLAETLKGFIETLSLPGLINIDFADVRTLLEGRGKLAYLHSATGSGATKAQASLKEVLFNPLGNYGIRGADRIMFNITGDKDLKMQDVSEIAGTISAANPRARIIFGIGFQPEFKDKARITLFASGCNEEVQVGKQKPATQKKTSKPKHKARVRVSKEAQRQGVKVVQPVKTEEVRRNALDLKKAVEEEIQELEKKEKAWDIPSFLRNKPAS